MNDEIQLLKLKELSLDNKYTNLLNPKNTSDDEYEDVLESWTSFHQEMKEMMDVSGFDWGVPDSMIHLVNRIYFDKEGKMEYYSYRILNPSISAKKNREFGELISSIGSQININLQRGDKFAQCGKVVYSNE
ncbi:MAG: hypothetical protein ACPG5P_09110 [Saprospiraceae bacterium]